MRFDLSKYSTVAERLAQFHKDYPDGRIITKLVKDYSYDGPKTWVFRTRVYLTAGDHAAGIPKATGYASEVDGTGGANNGSAAENSETSAIGRALANMNLSGNKRASRQEIEKVNRIADTDWIAEANALEDVKQLRSLYTRARAQGAPAEVLDMVKARAESLSGKDS